MSSTVTFLFISSNVRSLTPLNFIDWHHYHTYKEIVDILLNLNTTHPEIVDLFSIGESWQGRSIYCLRLTNESQFQPKPKVLFVGYHHSREPISAEVLLYFVVQTVSEYGVDDAITRMINFCEIFVVVALNPDGFDLFESNDWQRKNARPIDEDGDGLVDEDPPEDVDGDGLVEYLFDTRFGMFIRWEGKDSDGDNKIAEDWIGGVDLNRNYDFAWNASTQSGSSEPSFSDYKGLTPFSEPETRALRDLVMHHEFKYAVSFHSGAEIILFPWGYTREPPLHQEKFNQIGKELSTLIGVPYGQCGDSLYTASGTWDDWMYGNQSVLAFTCEIYKNHTEWVSEPGPDPHTEWRGGLRYVFNPRPHKIEEVVLKWLPLFAYITDRAIKEKSEEIHDVAVAQIKPFRTIISNNTLTTINVTVENQGDATETFRVVLYANNTIIQTQKISLESGDSKTVTFKWNTEGFLIGNYVIKAIADQIENETELNNNLFIYGIIQISIPGDINADGKVNMLDLTTAAIAFQSSPGRLKWNSNADVNEDRIINIIDLTAIANNFGKSL